jgi:hypothetical protein
MIYDKSLPLRMIVFCSTHYLKILGLSVLILLAVSFHRVFPVLIRPTIVKGEVVDMKALTEQTYSSHRYGYSYRDSRTIQVNMQVIGFEYDGKRYLINGGSDEADAAIGRSVNVIVPAYSPQQAVEFSVEGLLDFTVASFAFKIWFFLSAILYGVVILDKHFNHFTFDFDFSKLTKKRALVIALICLSLPLVRAVPLLVWGQTTMGSVTDEFMFCSDKEAHRVVSYVIADKAYKLGAKEYDDRKSSIGSTVSLIYDKSEPEHAMLYSFKSLYMNNWLIPSGLGLIFLIAIYFGARIKDDDDDDDQSDDE